MRTVTRARRPPARPGACHGGRPYVPVGIDNELEPQITVAEPAVEEVEFIPFEEFQKSLEN